MAFDPAAVLSDAAPHRIAAIKELYLGRRGATAFLRLDRFTSLETLYANDNALPSLAGIGDLFRLRRLYASHNRVASVAGLVSCKFLEELDVSSNGVAGLDATLDALSQFTFLRVLWLHHNPVAQEVRAVVEFVPRPRVRTHTRSSACRSPTTACVSSPRCPRCTYWTT